MMEIAFCDDISEERKQLMDFAAKYAKEHALHIRASAYDSAESLLRDTKAFTMDALFLDIYMGKIDGVEAAHILREGGYVGAIVLCTTSKDHFADGFAVDASHYLVKPLAYEAFSEAMRRVLRLTSAANRSIDVQIKGGNIPVPVSQIQYAEVYNHETILHLSDRNLTVAHSLSALEELLGGEPFLRCFRSYIVNMAYVEKLEKNDFLMKSGETIPIARDGKKGIQSRYMAYVFGHMEGL